MAYEPHPRLGMKVVPSKTDYDRSQNAEEISKAIEELEELDPYSPFYEDQLAEEAQAEEMYEHGFHHEMSEN